MKPCGTLYHPSCVVAGPSFTSRRANSAGLSFPRVSEWPNFICELCTVRSVLQRELGHPGDRWLLQLERVRLLDTAHNWAPGTIAGYQSYLRSVRVFESSHPGLSILKPKHLDEPPRSLDIPTMWMELHASAQTLRPRGRLKARTPAHVTVRQIRSAISQYHTLDQLTAYPGASFFSEKRKHLVGPCRPTDCASFTMFDKGFSARIGTDSVPSTSLLGRHVLGLDLWMTTRLQEAAYPFRIEWAMARVANLVSWLAWTRSGETFALEWRDVTIIRPDQGDAHDLPPGCGAVLLRLQPETKNSRSVDADIVVAYTTTGKLSLGEAIEDLYSRMPWEPLDTDGIFQSEDGTRWTSTHFRSTFLHPGLRHLKQQGDPFLSTMEDRGPNSIENKFWSLHCYRRGARTHCQRASRGRQKATDSQVYEHGRWRKQRSHEQVDIQYREWTLRDRVKITLYCY